MPLQLLLIILKEHFCKSLSDHFLRAEMFSEMFWRTKNEEEEEEEEEKKPKTLKMNFSCLQDLEAPHLENYL